MKGFSRVRMQVFCILACASIVSASCGNDDEFKPQRTTLEEIHEADESHFEATWKADVKQADRAQLHDALQELTPQDNVYRVQKDADLLDGLAVDDVVVWDGQGVFRILELTEEGDNIAVTVEWADIRDVAESFDAHFKHELSAGAPGRALGVGAGPPPQAGGQAGYIMQPITVGDGSLDFSENGVDFDGETVGTTFRAMNDSIHASLSAQGPGTTATVSGTLSGLSAEGSFTYNEGDDAADVELRFNNIQLTVTAGLEIDDASGETDLLPPAQIVFPFAVGPIPMYVSVGMRVGIRSTARSEDQISISASVSATGSLVIRRTADGDTQVDGNIHSFDTDRPSLSSTSRVTIGAGLDFDVPRIAFGVGRPSLVSAELYGTHSAELVGNTVVTSGDGGKKTCSTISTGSAVLYGGLISFFGLSFNAEGQAAFRDGISNSFGDGCN